MRLYNINIITDNPNDSTSFYRAWGVFNQIRKQEDLPLNLSEETRFGWNTVNKFDLLYMHRAYSKEHLAVIQIAKQNGVPVWVDYDDDLLGVPAHNPAYNTFKNCKKDFTEIIELADYVSVTTKGLQGLIQQDCKRKDVHIIENFVPLRVYMTQPKKQAKFRIFWRGSATHEMDWITHKEAFIEFVKRHKNVKFTNIGDMPLAIKTDIAKHCEVETLQGRKLIEYLLLLRMGLGDVAFVPLEKNRFNVAKSDIACQESLIGGMDAVAPVFNHEGRFSFNSVGDVVDKLDEVYEMWSDDYYAYKDGILAEQKQLLTLYDERYQKRIDLLKKIMKL